MDLEPKLCRDIPSPAALHLCNICDKPFLNESSYNRHVLYCRRTRARPRTRPKSCQPCTKSKRKCSGQLPCQRCMNKGAECAYSMPTPGRLVKETVEATKQSSDRIIEAVDNENWSINPHDLNDIGQFSTSSGEIDADLGQRNIDWDCLDLEDNEMLLLDPNLAESTLTHTHDDNVDPLIFDLQALPENNTETLGNAELGLASKSGLLLHQGPRSKQGCLGNGQNVVAGSRHDSGQHSTALLERIRMRDHMSKFTANIVMQMLCAFPQMMVRRETFPPFIHGHWYCTSSSTSPSLPKPLVSCMGLAQVFSSQNIDTRPFLWDKVREEHRSAADKAYRRQFSKRDHLAAVQALLIYIMMRVVDCSKIEPNLNLELLVTYQGLCDSFKDVCNEPFYKHEEFSSGLSWEDWIFAESRRRYSLKPIPYTISLVLYLTGFSNYRTAIIWLLITQMVHIKIGVPCDSFPSFRDVPLSSPKSLWEAKTRSEWEKEYRTYKSTPGTGLHVFGDLYDACKERHLHENQLKLNGWNSTIDNLGSLLNLGAEIM